jgi:hypothetical protein
MRRLRLLPVLTGVRIDISPSLAVLPGECACCGNPATHHSALRHGGGSLLVGYCDECAEHQAGSSARALALSLSSLLLALVTAAGLPLLLPRLPALGLALVTFLASLLPLLLLLAPERAPEPPHSARAPAVLWQAERQLWCANERYGERVAKLNGARAVPASARASLGSAWLSAGPLLGVGAALLSFLVYHPLLRIINLGSTRIDVAIDGAYLASVDATSNESPSAGALLRVPAGPHVLSVRSAVDGALLERAEVELRSGSVHLFAPGAAGICFWLETTGYGQERLTKLSYQPLASDSHFWVLPGGIDTWFAENPAPTDAHAQSSGGLLTALRQAPCTEAPPEARGSQ